MRFVTLGRERRGLAEIPGGRLKFASHVRLRIEGANRGREELLRTDVARDEGAKLERGAGRREQLGVSREEAARFVQHLVGVIH